MSVANFIPQIWSARLLSHLDKFHVYAALCNRDYEGDIKAYGDSVIINQISDINVYNYDGSEISDPDELSGTQQILYINQAKYFNFQIRDIDNAQTNPKLLEDAMQRASYSVNDVIDGYLASLMVTDCSTSNIIYDDNAPLVPTDNTAYDCLVDLATVLSENNVPMLGRWVVVPPWFHSLLLKDSRFVSNGTPFNQSVLQSGLVGEAAGLTIYVSNNVPNANNAKFKIIAGSNIAASFAEQLVEMEAKRMEHNFADCIRALHVFGAKVLRPNALAIATVNKS